MRNLAKSVCVGMVASLWACGSPEQSAIDRFFRAAMTGDRSAAAAMSAVGAPAEVESWEVVEVRSRTVVPFEMPELTSKRKVAMKARDDQLDEGRQYLVANRDALDQIIPKLQEDEDFQFRGELGEIQTVWMKYARDRKVMEREYQDSVRAVDAELKLAARSLLSEIPMETLEFFEGDIAVTEVLMSLDTADADPKLYTVTLRKYEIHRPKSETLEPSRWIIVGVEEASPT